VRPPGLSLVVLPDAAAVAAVVATRIVAAIEALPDLVLGLPTGRTPVALYDDLRGRRDVSFARVATFNLDEFLGLGVRHPGSYRQFMERHLFAHVDLDPRRVHFLAGDTPDPESECERYERDIVAAGGIDLQILGIGTNGHIGFNEPAPALQARTHRVTLREESRRSNAGLFPGGLAEVPREALSMGMATILQSREILLMAIGHQKAACIAAMVEDPITTLLPASFLQLHPAVTVVLDEAAASALQRQDDGRPEPA
jgi:glucosamine-6-phosphate deaminase